MEMREFAGDGVGSGTFDDGYTRAKKLVLENNDVQGAVDCLNRVKPQSQPGFWQWTDLMVALLFKKGEYSECRDVLGAYDTRYPGDPRIASTIRKLGETGAAPGASATDK